MCSDFFLQSPDCVYRFFSCPLATETFFFCLQSRSQHHAGGPPFLLAMLITSPSSKSPGRNLRPSSFCPGKLLDLHFFSLKFKKIFQVDESWNRREAVSFQVTPPQGAGYCPDVLISPTWGFLEAISNVQAHLVTALVRVYLGGFPGGSDGKESACNAADMSSIPGSGRSAGKGNGSPLQYSWRILWIEEPGGPQSMWSHRVGHDRVTRCTHVYLLMTVSLGCCLFDVTPSLFFTFQYFPPHGRFINCRVPWNSLL